MDRQTFLLPKGIFCCMMLIMAKVDKLIAKMKNNPRDWRIDSLMTVARTYEIEWRQPGTSHVTFRNSNGSKITVPAHKPIKPIYIKKFIRFVEESIGR